MDCLEAQAIVSAQRDGEVIAAADLQTAHDHCSECPDCAAFESGLAWLAVMPSPSVPDGLAERVMGVVAVAAAARAEADRLEAERLEDEAQQMAVLEASGPLPEPPEPRPSWERLPTRWFGAAPVRWFERVPAPARWAGLGALGTIAATALIAFVLLGGRSDDNTGIKDVATSEAGRSAATAPGLTYSDDGQAAGSAQAPAVPANAPDYVLFRGVVFSPGALLADANSATPTLGTVSTAFASTGGPQQASVLKSPLSDGSIVVQGPDGLRVYAPVVRLLSSVRYQLAAGNALDRFGIWPTLPTRFTVPAGADGSPSFVSSGIDALGVKVYAAAGRPVNEGFAVAPGTESGDPAGGNPNWTWWTPMKNQTQ